VLRRQRLYFPEEHKRAVNTAYSKRSVTATHTSHNMKHYLH